MQTTTLTKTRFKIALECPRKLEYATDKRYANLKDIDDLLKALAEGGHQVGALAKLMHPGGMEITAPAIEDQIRETERLLQEENIMLFEPTFRHGNLVVRVDVLVKRGRDIRLIEVKAKGFAQNGSFRAVKDPIKKEWRPYLYDVAFQKLVLERSHPEWTITPYLMLLDTSVEASMAGVGAQFQVDCKDGRAEVTLRPGFDPKTLEKPLLRAIDVTEEVRILRDNPVETPAGTHRFEELIDWLAADLAAGTSLPPYTGGQCKSCEFYCEPDEITADRRSGWAECFEAAYGRRIEWPRSATVFGLCGHKNVGALLRPDRFALAEVDVDDLKVKINRGEITPTQRNALQVEEARGEGEAIHLERDSLRQAMAQWRFPMHFIDFETSRPALPFHQGRTPNDLLLFQFSHHTLSKDGTLRHSSQCLITDPDMDPSIAVVRELRKALSGNDGTVVHWWDHEKTVLKEIRKRIAASGEEDGDELIAFIDSLVGDDTGEGRLADLGRLVSKTTFFQGTNGRSSIKKVLPAVLAHSKWLKNRYDKPIYGTTAMPSLNFPTGWVWLQMVDGQVQDPYKLLEPIAVDREIQEAIDQGDEEDQGNQSFIANGGAAMVAYAKLQNPDISDKERQGLEAQLQRYCELDTLAMVMVYEAIQRWIS